VSRTDHWHCESCGLGADLGRRSVEVGLVRAAVRGTESFGLGSGGIEQEVGALLAPCGGCGGRLVPGEGSAPGGDGRFDAALLRPVAVSGWARLKAEPRLSDLRDVWRPRALGLIGREDELSREDVLRLRLEDKLASLQAELEAAEAAGDSDAAEAAHARYIELGTTYVRRFVRSDDPVSQP
jgi:hypothetical protein